jgi:hypothetical protein
MSEIAVLPHEGLPIPVLVISVFALAFTIYRWVLKLVLPKDSQVPKQRTEPARATDRPDLPTNHWLLLIPFAVCPLVAVTVTNCLNYVARQLWPLSYVFESVLMDLPWFYALCIFTAFPGLILYERYRGRKPHRLIQGMIFWVVASTGYERLVTTFYETWDSDSIRMVTSAGGGVIAAIFYWLIMRYCSMGRSKVVAKG